MADKWGDKLQGTARRLYEAGKLALGRDGELPVLDKRANADAWAAWRRWRIDNKLSVAWMDKSERWTVPAMFPPAELTKRS